MPEERPRLNIEGDEKTAVEAGWGRSGKRLILTVATTTASQVVLTVEQAAELGQFLAAGPTLD